MKQVTFLFKNGQKAFSVGEEVVYYKSSGSVYIDGEQTVVYNQEVADDYDVIAYTVKEIITLKELVLSKKPGKVVKKLNQLNIGLSNTVFGAWASKWSAGYHKPELEEIVQLRKLMLENSPLLGGGWQLLPLRLQLERHF